MGCNCGGDSGPSSKYRVTTTDGQVRVFLTETEAHAAVNRAGGGTIEVVA